MHGAKPNLQVYLSEKYNHKLSKTHSLLWIDLNIIMELLLVTFVFATTILFVPAGGCGVRSPVPDELREKRSAVDPVDVNTGHTLSERAALAPVADEESEGGRFRGKRAAASPLPLVVEGSFAVGHGHGQQ